MQDQESRPCHPARSRTGEAVFCPALVRAGEAFSCDVLNGANEGSAGQRVVGGYLMQALASLLCWPAASGGVALMGEWAEGRAGEGTRLVSKMTSAGLGWLAEEEGVYGVRQEVWYEADT